ncbi:hypothetical protein [Aeromonas caviae]|uniref:hypothetical protein n=1 Tax=Aeromonas caviae TaxID=648 RepID=UPI001BD0CECB|nr:hypothetical protein [Aeromonas caviae]MBS4712901.1 hypothetical protein [Aeromonas caviae]
MGDDGHLSSLTIAAIFGKAEQPGHETSLFLLLNFRLINQYPDFHQNVIPRVTKRLFWWRQHGPTHPDGNVASLYRGLSFVWWVIWINLPAVLSTV